MLFPDVYWVVAGHAKCTGCDIREVTTERSGSCRWQEKYSNGPRLDFRAWSPVTFLTGHSLKPNGLDA